MRGWLKLVGIVCAVSGIALVASVADAGARHSGTVISVTEDRLVLDELVAGAKERRFTVRLTPETKVVLSVRSEHPTDLEHAFATTAIRAADIKPGDFVVVELSDKAGRAGAESVTVTLQRAKDM